MIVMLFFLFGRPGTLGLLLRPVLWFLWIPRIHCYTETACRVEAHISHFWKAVKRFFWKKVKNIFDIVKKFIILLAFWIESSRIQSTTFPQRIPVLITSTIKAGFSLRMKLKSSSRQRAWKRMSVARQGSIPWLRNKPEKDSRVKEWGWEG